ncbi:MAG: tRNA (adenine(22)-N(1))-methyltransferase TrmK [[Clostridium] leptum]
MRKYQVEDIVELRLSDGLQAFLPEEADFIVIAGMGGEVIASILGAVPWLKETGARLVLQPMTRAEELRRFLAEHGV